MRYAKQDNRTSCGPTVLGNVLKALRIGSYSSERTRLKKLCNYRPAFGVFDCDVIRAACRLSLKHKFLLTRMLKPTFGKMVRAAQRGDLLIVSFRYPAVYGKPRRGHIALVSSVVGGDLFVVNDCLTDDQRSSLLHRTTTARLWRNRIRRGGFGCWRISLT